MIRTSIGGEPSHDGRGRGHAIERQRPAQDADQDQRRRDQAGQDQRPGGPERPEEQGQPRLPDKTGQRARSVVPRTGLLEIIHGHGPALDRLVGEEDAA